MRKLLLRWIVLAVSVAAASYVSHALRLGFDVSFLSEPTAKNFVLLLLGVAVLSLLNATVGKILKLLTLPLSCITFGLFSLVINAIVLELAAALDLGFSINKKGGFSAFIAAFVASLLISFINGVLGVFLPDDEKES
ncbi:MAG TPA: phage holin family protein [Fimbriimonadaceae bacterium]|nr:phage holin family protein [Fimbriimonadaceae bacterium]